FSRDWSSDVCSSDLFQAQLHNELIGGGFARSKFIQDNIAVPIDMIQATFGKNFQIENGKVVAVGADGQKIYSRTRPGEIADFDEIGRASCRERVENS